jgi:precorrin-6Y C5,15-methyltransferase (decarboxylating)
MSNKLYVIGIGYKPLDKKAQEIISRAGVILASNRLFEIFKGYDEFEAIKDKVKVINNVNETIEFIRAEVRKCGSAELKNFRTSELPGFRAIVLLASGDPMFFGIGRRAVKEFGRDMVEILPDLSSVQIAFSRIKEPWDDAFLMSLHGGPDPEKRRRLPYTINDIPSLLQRHNKVAILTDRENNPSAIADVVARSKATKQSKDFEIASPMARNDSIRLFVCERLGYQDEKITEGSPEEIAGMTFSEPNVVILKNEKTSSMSFPLVGNLSELYKGSKKDCGQAAMTDDIRFGLKETEISHSKGLITKDEVRAVTIHKLRLPQRGVFWDIGAGSGSVSIEAARLYPELKVFAVEKDKEQINHIEKNKIQFNAANVEIINGEASDALNALPSPDRVFIGGSGERLGEIINIAASSGAAIIVINAATLETLNEGVQSLENSGYQVNVSEISVSRSKVIAGKKYLQAFNPIFIISGELLK